MMAVVRSQATIPTVVAGGKLVKVELRPGVGIKLTEAEARKRGLLPPEPDPEPETKKRAPAANKKRAPVSNKKA